MATKAAPVAPFIAVVCPVNIFATDADCPPTASSQNATCREGRSHTGGAWVSPALPYLPGEWVGRTTPGQTAIWSIDDH